MQRLLWKLLLINILTIGSVIGIVWWAIDYLAAGYFIVLMEKYHISPGSSHEMFVESIHRYLITASAVALLLAIILSYVLMKRVLGPLTAMTETTKKIAAGEFSVTVPVTTHDEVGQLAAAFNSMVRSLEDLESLRKRLIIDVAHELRTPFTNIQGYLEALIDGVVPPTRQTFELLHDETLRLIRLVDDVMRLARADRAKAHLKLSPVRIQDVLTPVLKTFQFQSEEKRISLTTDLPDDDDTVNGDADLLAQVIRNILHNAFQYSPEGGPVRIKVNRSGDMVVTEVTNLGAEVAVEDLPLIFERFYRGEKSRSRRYGGAGIGLAIVKELIDAHGGSVGAHSENGKMMIWFRLKAHSSAGA